MILKQLMWRVKLGKAPNRWKCGCPWLAYWILRTSCHWVEPVWASRCWVGYCGTVYGLSVEGRPTWCDIPFGARPYMNHWGNGWDNAPMESMFRSFKSEWVPSEGYRTLADAKKDITHYGAAPTVAEEGLNLRSGNSWPIVFTFTSQKEGLEFYFQLVLTFTSLDATHALVVSFISSTSHNRYYVN